MKKFSQNKPVVKGAPQEDLNQNVQQQNQNFANIHIRRCLLLRSALNASITHMPNMVYFERAPNSTNSVALSTFGLYLNLVHNLPARPLEDNDPHKAKLFHSINYTFIRSFIPPLTNNQIQNFNIPVSENKGFSIELGKNVGYRSSKAYWNNQINIQPVVGDEKVYLASLETFYHKGIAAYGRELSSNIALVPLELVIQRGLAEFLHEYNTYMLPKISNNVITDDKQIGQNAKNLAVARFLLFSFLKKYADQGLIIDPALHFINTIKQIDAFSGFWKNMAIGAGMVLPTYTAGGAMVGGLPGGLIGLGVGTILTGAEGINLYYQRKQLNNLIKQFNQNNFNTFYQDNQALNLLSKYINAEELFYYKGVLPASTGEHAFLYGLIENNRNLQLDNLYKNSLLVTIKKLEEDLGIYRQQLLP